MQQQSLACRCWSIYFAAVVKITLGQGVERHEPVVGKRIVVNQELALAGEEGPGRGNVEIIEGLDGVGADSRRPGRCRRSGGGYRPA